MSNRKLYCINLPNPRILALFKEPLSQSEAIKMFGYTRGTLYKNIQLAKKYRYIAECGRKICSRNSMTLKLYVVTERGQAFIDVTSEAGA